MQKAKEAASNAAASAKAGMDKTKAVVQEKVDKMTAQDPVGKDMATQRKEERITQAEMNKQQTREHNAAAAGTGVPGTGGTYSHSTTGQSSGGAHLVEGTHLAEENNPIPKTTGIAGIPGQGTHVTRSHQTGHGTGLGGI